MKTVKRIESAAERSTTQANMRFPELEYTEGKHVYTLNGFTIPSVTTLMKPLSVSKYKEIDPEVLRLAAERGHRIHWAVENFISTGMDDIEPSEAQYFQAFKDWLNDTGAKVIASECRVYHKQMLYAGTVDLICEIDGKLVLIDLKSSYAVNRMLTTVQLIAYVKAFESHGEIVFDSSAILHLKKNGTYDYVEHDPKDSEAWTTFGACITLHNHIRKYEGK